jgi:hypothetical protein
MSALRIPRTIARLSGVGVNAFLGVQLTRFLADLPVSDLPIPERVSAFSDPIVAIVAAAVFWCARTIAERWSTKTVRKSAVLAGMLMLVIFGAYVWTRQSFVIKVDVPRRSSKEPTTTEELLPIPYPPTLQSYLDGVQRLRPHDDPLSWAAQSDPDKLRDLLHQDSRSGVGNTQLVFLALYFAMIVSMSVAAAFMFQPVEIFVESVLDALLP